ncbi:MAG TPA: hypothetical protein VG960_03780 [Caulobacteraceae bacterium]|nr:hypothetical protein [Caulobacteraceae bacterium]
MTVTDNEPAVPKKRGVSLILGIGIFLIPLIFWWFTLRKGYSTRARAISGAWAGLFLLVYLGGHSTHTTPQANGTTKVSSTQTTQQAGAESTNSGTGAAASGAAVADSGGWTYSETKDEMRGTSSKFAILDSQDEQSFGFPYHGGTTTLELRKDHSGTNVLLKVKRSVFM